MALAGSVWFIRPAITNACCRSPSKDRASDRGTRIVQAGKRQAPNLPSPTLPAENGGAQSVGIVFQPCLRNRQSPAWRRGRTTRAGPSPTFQC